MAESMSEQIFSIACALSKADESEKSMLRMICTAQEESLVRALKESVAKEDCERVYLRGVVVGDGRAGERESGWGGVFLPARGRPDSDEAFVR